jgi:hypothetical protein
MKFPGFARSLVFVLCLGVAGAGVFGQADGQDKKERHPHMRAAIIELKEARRELKEADHDFGGHRVKALEAIDVAVEQMEKALKFDKK